MNFTNLIKSRSERLFHLTDTNEDLSEVPGISFEKSYHDRARVKEGSEPAYALKLMNDRKLKFRGEEKSFSLFLSHQEKKSLGFSLTSLKCLITNV